MSAATLIDDSRETTTAAQHCAAAPPRSDSSSPGGACIAPSPPSKKKKSPTPTGPTPSFSPPARRSSMSATPPSGRLTSLRSRIVSYWRGLTLPYVEPGVRLIRQDDIESFAHVLEGFRDELSQAETELDAVYESMKEDARRRLGQLYCAKDYPSEIRGLFAVEWDFPAVEPPSYLMRLSPDLYAQEQQRIAQRFEEAVRLAEEAFTAEFAKLVAHLSERLSSSEDGQTKVFRDSAVSNLVDFFERFRKLNVQSNAQLDELVEQARQLVSGVKPQSLRDNDGLRQQVATQLAQVQSVLDGMLVDQPRRRIVRAHPSLNGDDHALEN